MGQPAAKDGDKVVATDLHTVITPGPSSALLPHLFSGSLDGELAASVKVDGKQAAVSESTCRNSPGHVPTPPGTSFVNAPSNSGTVKGGSGTVRICGKPAARANDMAQTCSESPGADGQIVGTSSVKVG